jgi:hypothetical protein
MHAKLINNAFHLCMYSHNLQPILLNLGKGHQMNYISIVKTPTLMMFGSNVTYLSREKVGISSSLGFVVAVCHFKVWVFLPWMNRM